MKCCSLTILNYYVLLLDHLIANIHEHYDKIRMSNSNLTGEINKKLPIIREKIYRILRREKYKDLTEKNTDTQERIKKSVRDRSNELLPVGSGVVKDVFFSKFIIK